MVYLPPVLAQRRSAQAAALSRQQQNMGVVPTAAPVAPEQRTPAQPGMPMAGGGVPAGGGGFTPEITEQPSKFRAILQQRQQQQALIEARSQDLRLAQMMGMALDPSVPKGFRQLGLRQISQQLGVDPRGERAKEIINTISGLDPQSLEGIRRGIMSSTSDTQPGELTQMTRGILTGQVPPEQLMSLARSATQAPAADTGVSGDTQEPGLFDASAAGGGDVGGGYSEQPPMRLGSSPVFTDMNAQITPEDTMSPVTPIQYRQPNVPGAPLPPRPGPGIGTQSPQQAPSPQIPTIPEANIPPRMREANPGIVNAFGLDPTVRYRNQDLIAAGWPRVPVTEAEANKALNDISSSQEGTISTMRMAAQLSALIGNRPEVLGTGDVGHPVDRQGILTQILNSNPAALIDEMNNTLRSMGIAVGTGGNWLDRVAETDPLYDTVVGRAARDAASSIGQLFHTPGDTREMATTNAQIRAILVPLAFAMAAAQGQTGRFLSDRDVALQLQSLGQSRSPDQFQAALSTTVERIYNSYNTRMRATFGGPVPLEHAVNDADRNVLANSPVVPRALVSALGGPDQQPAAPASAPGAPASRPSGPPGSAYPEGPPRRTGEIPGTPPLPGGPLPPLPNASPAAPSTAQPSLEPGSSSPPTTQQMPPPREPLSRRTITRTGPTLEQESEAAVQRAQEDRNLRLAENARQQRMLQIAESAEARAQREEVERRRERIRQAFAAIANSLKGGITATGGGLISSTGSEGQDANAFRIGQRQGRQAPTPVSAAPYQPQIRRRYTSG